VVAKIRIVCDGGGPYGFGNLRRSTTLAEYFRSHGHTVWINSVSERAQRLLPAFGPGQREQEVADLWLLDLPYNGDEWVRKARFAKCRVAALDFAGVDAPDLIISVFDHGNAPSGCDHVVGLEYAIIRQDIVALAPALAGEGVIVIIGGGDDIGLGETVAARVAEFASKVMLIDGPLAKITQDLPTRIDRRQSPPELASLMAGCEWGVTSGGGAMLEMMCLGKPAFVIPRTGHEASLAKFVFSKGAILGVGAENLRAPAAEALSKASDRARSLVDGRGGTRIVQAVEALL
jgi:spore coat polysaccharide biosynthesis predicted glycosyltransferase SpsG